MLRAGESCASPLKMYLFVYIFFTGGIYIYMTILKYIRDIMLKIMVITRSRDKSNLIRRSYEGTGNYIFRGNWQLEAKRAPTGDDIVNYHTNTLQCLLGSGSGSTLVFCSDPVVLL